ATDKIEGIQANVDRDKEAAQKKDLIADEMRRDPGGRGRARAYQLAASFAAQEAQEVKLTLQGLSNLGKYVDPDSTGEHISVLLICGGLNVRPGKQYFEMIGQLAGSESLAQEMETSSAGYDERQEIKKRIAMLNRANITIYALSIYDPHSAYISNVG